MKSNLLFLFFAFFTSLNAHSKIVKYELVATKGPVNLSGNRSVDFAIKINGHIPAPVLEFTEGDEAEIKLINNIPDDEVSIHWHGILIDPYMDGVPYVTTPPIKSGKSFTFKFKLRQHGTFWYHSHTNVQEQKGVYGAIVIHPKSEKKQYDKELVLVLSDWSDEDPSDILKNLRKDGDYYIYKKGTMRSWFDAFQKKSLTNYLKNQWSRMGGMDFSDVGYDAFLINGKKESQGLIAKKGEKIRVRIINAAASTYFYVSLGNEPMKVISADGTDIKPLFAKELFIGMAETYDVLLEINEEKNYELRATSQDGTGHTSTWIGTGEKISSPHKSKPNPYMDMSMDMGNDSMNSMDHSKMDMKETTMDHSKMDMKETPIDHSKMDMKEAPMDHSKMDMEEATMDHSKRENNSSNRIKESNNIIETLTSYDFESPAPTNFPLSIPRHDVTLILDGDMARYIWLINGKAIHEDRNIIINENEVIRFTFVNNSMMNHPMHLHGHFFRVLNKFANNSPMKHTVDVPPFSTKTIEFFSNEPGEWMLHCHNLYHLNTGMAKIVKYSSFTPRPEVKEFQKHDPHLHDHIYFKGMLEASTIHSQAQVNFMDTWNELVLKSEFRNNYSSKNFEGDAFYKRWINKYFSLIFGGTYFKKDGFAVAGVGYILPLLIDTNLLVNHKGKLRLDLMKRFQWTKNIFTEADFTFRQKEDTEFELSLMYQSNWSWSAGLMFTEDKAGVGFHYQF